MTRPIEDFARSDDYRNRIHDLVPGGAHTYSKGDDQFPSRAPAAIVRGRGSRVWDPDGNEYLDCSMGLTSVSLGHAHPPVLERVRSELERGVNFQRPSVLELEMAERFLGAVSQHDMVKFAKNGSTVTTAAVKLARALTGRPLVAFPGDHPFYSYDDWFIGSTACRRGVPEEVSALSVTFRGCDLESLRALFERHPGQIACVITEPERSTCGAGCSCSTGVDDFLRQAIDLAHANGALFILDEMVSGFKTDFPGAISRYDLRPDMATWGKGIANGFSFCALTGTREVMELGGIRDEGAERVFLISTTHGAETHGMAAALATLDAFEQEGVIEHNQTLGARFIERSRHELDASGVGSAVRVVPCPWLPTFLFHDAEGAVSSGMRTLFMQEMIRWGVLFQGIVSPCLSHSDEDVDLFGRAFGKALEVYARALDEGWENHLVGPPAKPVFRSHV
ncbi:MAG: glutamate-1-semialdehyde 2,1-aminomutase [Longimicrobiales bacterium]